MSSNTPPIVMAMPYSPSQLAGTSLEESGNIFDQLDSMIEAVQLESNALDMMRGRLKELDAMKTQLTTLTRRLLDAEKSNLSLSGNLTKMTDSYDDLKKSKTEIESSIPPLKQELLRTKEMYTKERVARLGLQQEASRLQSIVEQLQSANQELEREYKTIPALHESNEILRHDLGQLRQRYKEEKMQMGRRIKTLEGKLTEAERTKHSMHQIAARLMAVVSTDGPDVAMGMQIRRPQKLVSLTHPKARGTQDFDEGQPSGAGDRYDMQPSIESRATYASHSAYYGNDEFDDDDA